MSLLKTLLLTQSAGADKPPVIWPMEYVFTEGTASPYNIKYDDTEGLGPYTVMTSEINAMTGTSSQRKLARTSDGTLYIVYYKLLSGKYQIYVAKSIDNGATWTGETRISTGVGMQSYDQSEPSIAVDLNDYLHVVWRDYTTNCNIWYALYNGAWQTPVRISTYAGMDSLYQFTPSIAVDSSNYLHVVWYGTATGYTTKYQIWYALYNGAWQTPVRISTYAGMDSNSQSSPSIAVDSNDYLHVVWYGYATAYTTKYQIWYALYNGAWQAPVRISTYAGMEQYDQAFVSIAVDSNDYLHVVWYGNATGYTVLTQIWYALYNGAWQAPVRISTYTGMDGYNQVYPSIAVDSSNYLHVIWSGKAWGYTDFDKVWYAKYEASWAAPIILQTTGQNRYTNLRWSRWP